MDFTYEFPDSDAFLYTLQQYLEKRGNRRTSELLDNASCYFSATDQYTRHRWNELFATLIIRVSLDVFDKFSEEVQQELAVAADALMPPEAGYEISDVQITPQLTAPDSKAGKAVRVQ